MENKKCISPVVATALLLIVAVIAVVGFGDWFGSFQTKIESNINSDSNNLKNHLEIDTIIDNNLYINNKNNKNITLKNIYVNGIDCNITKNVIGIENLDLSKCLENFSNEKIKIIVETDNGIVQKNIFIKKKKESFSSIQSLSFISVWNTSEPGISNSNQIKLPLESDGVYNFTIDWGDDSIETITSYNQPAVTHTYATAGIYTVKITGDIKGFRFNYGGDSYKLLDIESWGQLNLGNNGDYFANCQNLIGTFTDSLDLTGTTNLKNMFNSAIKFNGDISNWDVSQVTNMLGMFEFAQNFNGDISNWDVSQVENMYCMFCNVINFNSDISNWDVGSVIDMQLMFFNAQNFNQNLSNWDVSQVTKMYSMFNSAIKFNGDISNWDVSSLKDMRDMFNFAIKFNQDLSDWDVSSVLMNDQYDKDAMTWQEEYKPNF